MIRLGANDKNPGRGLALLGFQVILFLFASLLHRGFIVGGYEHGKAAIAETVIGAVLLSGLLAAMRWSRSARAVVIGVQAFALVGTFVGAMMIVIGVGPRSPVDIAIHVIMFGTLIYGLLAAMGFLSRRPQ